MAFSTILIAAVLIAAFLIIELSPHPELQNCVWLVPSSEGLGLMNNPSLWQPTVARLEQTNIHCIIVWAGWWNTNHTIMYADSPTVWTQFIDTVKSADPKSKVLALVGTGGGIDISTPEYRTEMINSIKQLLASAPFNGWNDDLESYTGSNQDLIAYWQGMASMVRGMGRIATADASADWSTIVDVYPHLTNLNYIMPMFYSTISYSAATQYWNAILSNSPVPVIMGLAIDPPANGNVSLAQQLSWVDQQSHKNLQGFSIWAYDYWNTADFAAWSNWPTKNTI